MILGRVSQERCNNKLAKLSKISNQYKYGVSRYTCKCLFWDRKNNMTKSCWLQIYMILETKTKSINKFIRRHPEAGGRMKYFQLPQSKAQSDVYYYFLHKFTHFTRFRLKWFYWTIRWSLDDKSAYQVPTQMILLNYPMVSRWQISIKQSSLENLKIGPLVLGSFGMKSAGFYGHEIWQISWNPVDFMVESGKFNEIWWISWWNPANFMKSGGFNGWYPADFMADLEKCKLEM